MNILCSILTSTLVPKERMYVWTWYSTEHFNLKAILFFMLPERSSLSVIGHRFFNGGGANYHDFRYHTLTTS